MRVSVEGRVPAPSTLCEVTARSVIGMLSVDYKCLALRWRCKEKRCVTRTMRKYPIRLRGARVPFGVVPLNTAARSLCCRDQVWERY